MHVGETKENSWHTTQHEALLSYNSNRHRHLIDERWRVSGMFKDAVLENEMWLANRQRCSWTALRHAGALPHALTCR